MKTIFLIKKERVFSEPSKQFCPTPPLILLLIFLEPQHLMKKGIPHNYNIAREILKPKVFYIIAEEVPQISYMLGH